ncbi:AP-3 complex subunit beta-2-like isoform X2 [Brachyistius frenatus]|uniref:AP-3 complex subunit beta-2-like isoform X2 n=1 Tax=Brachyistius frenatus TaxID=100188 RepID=UPI0037E7A1B3
MSGGPTGGGLRSSSEGSTESPKQSKSRSGPDVLSLSPCAACYNQKGRYTSRWGRDGESSSSAEDSGPEAESEAESESSSSSSSCAAAETPERTSPVGGGDAEEEPGGGGGGGEEEDEEEETPTGRRAGATERRGRGGLEGLRSSSPSLCRPRSSLASPVSLSCPAPPPSSPPSTCR